MRGLRSCRVFVGGLSNIAIDPETDFLFVSFKFPPGIFSPNEGSAAGRAVTPARVDFDYHGAFRTMFADQSPEQWSRDHLVFVLRVAGPNRYGAEGEVLGIASVPLRVVLEAPRFQLHTTLNVVGATSGSPPAGKLEIRLQLSTDPAPRSPGEVAYGGEALKLGVRLRDLRLHTDAEERALKGAARVAGGELPLLSVVIKTFHKGKLEGVTQPQNLVRPTLDHFWQVEVEADNSLLEFVRTGCVVLEVWSGLGAFIPARNCLSSARG